MSTVAGFFTWAALNLTYLRFCESPRPSFPLTRSLTRTLRAPLRIPDAGLKAQGLDRTKLIYYSTLQPWLAIWGLFWTVLFVLINGFEVFFSWDTPLFITSYINVPIFFALWIGWRVYKRTRFWRASEMDFVTGIPSVEETEVPEEPPTTLGGKIFNVLF